MAGARATAYSGEMNKNTPSRASISGLILGAALLPALIGCVVEPGYRRSRIEEPSVSVQASVIMDDDYVYYPGYETYYSNTRHQYVYRDGRNWVTRASPPRVSADIFLRSPSVHVDFRDSPAQHHAAVVKSYPKNWKPAPGGQAKPNDRKDDRKDSRDDDKRNHN